MYSFATNIKMQCRLPTFGGRDLLDFLRAFLKEHLHRSRKAKYLDQKRPNFKNVLGRLKTENQVRGVLKTRNGEIVKY